MMFFVILELIDGTRARERMPAHDAWIAQGFDDGVFVLVGSLQGRSGGAILVRNTSREELRERVQADPLVADGVVTAEIVELAPWRAAPELASLMAPLTP